MKRKELFWMVVPCLLLMGAGAYFSRRKADGVKVDAKPNVGPLRVVIDKISTLPPTPREASEGFDTCVKIEYHPIGRPAVPAWWKLKSAGDGDWGAMKLEFANPSYSREYNCQPYLNFGVDKPTSFMTDGEKISRIYRLQLAKIPRDAGTITLKAKVMCYESFTNVKTGAPAPNVWPSNKVPVSIVVRRAGQVIQKPNVSHYFPYSLQQVTIQDLTKTSSGSNYNPGDFLVSVLFKMSPTNPKQNMFAVGEIVDEKGFKYFFDGWGGVNLINTNTRGRQKLDLDPFYLSPEERGKIWGTEAWLNLSQIPASAGALYLKLRVYCEDYWAPTFRITLRDRGAVNSYCVGQKQPVILNPGNPRLGS